MGAQVPVNPELIDLFDLFERSSLVGSYSADDFYKHIGATEYTCIDINGQHNSLLFDLSRNLNNEYNYRETFDLVTNFGTSAAIFDQCEVFRNIHQLCNIDGYMIHTLPVQGWGQQWFYKYSTSFVEDLAASNNYQITHIEPFLRLKPYLKKNRYKSIQQVLILCDFVKSRINHNKSPMGSIPPDLEARRDIEKRNEVKDALVCVGKGDALFNITLACILKKTSGKDFVTPSLSLYQNSMEAFNA